MSDVLRPTFEIDVALPPERVSEVLERVFLDDPGRFVGQSARLNLTIALAPEHRHFWSPWLHIDLRRVEGDEHAAVVFGRFSPAPSVWTAYMLTYIALLTIALLAGAWACAQWMLERPPTLLWGVLAPCLVAAGMVWSAKVGQRLAREQMATLRDAVERSLEGVAGPATPSVAD